MRYLLLGIPFLLLCLLLAIVVLISDRETVVLETHTASPQAALTVKAVSQELKSLMKSSEPVVYFRTTEEKINDLLALASRAVPALKSHVDVTAQGLDGLFSLHVPRNPFGEYINVRFSVLPSEYRLSLHNISVGSLNISADNMVRLSRYLLDMLLDDDSGSRIIDAIQSVAVQHGEVTVGFRPIPDLKDRLSNLAEIRDDLQLLGDPAAIAFYYGKVCEMDRIYNPNTPISAMDYIAPIFALAYKRSSDSASVAAENQAALLALGVFLGSQRFANLVGGISEPRGGCRQEPANIGFKGYRDLVQHFFISSTIKILGDSNVSFAVGEYKELIDTKVGGFSVSDIAGNEAGIRFAELMLSGGPAAREAQRRVATSSDENTIFPSIDGMPPKLPRKEFEARYGSVDDPRYQAMLDDIQQRLSVLPVYAAQ